MKMLSLQLIEMNKFKVIKLLKLNITVKLNRNIFNFTKTKYLKEIQNENVKINGNSKHIKKILQH